MSVAPEKRRSPPIGQRRTRVGTRPRARSLAAPPDLPAVLRTLREVAAALALLHAQGIVHCDLTGAVGGSRAGGIEGIRVESCRVTPSAPSSVPPDVTPSAPSSVPPDLTPSAPSSVPPDVHAPPLAALWLPLLLLLLLLQAIMCCWRLASPPPQPTAAVAATPAASARGSPTLGSPRWHGAGSRSAPPPLAPAATWRQVSTLRGGGGRGGEGARGAWRAGPHGGGRVRGVWGPLPCPSQLPLPIGGGAASVWPLLPTPHSLWEGQGAGTGGSLA